MGGQQPPEPEPPTDAPPSYNEVINSHTHPGADQHPATSIVPNASRYHSVFPKKRASGTATTAGILTQDAGELHEVLLGQAPLPPELYVRVTGSHQETRHDGRERKKHNVTDFDFRLEMTRTVLHCSPGGTTSEWHDLHVVRDGDHQRAFRGGRWKTREWKEPGRPKGRTDLVLDGAGELEDRDQEEDRALMGADAGVEEDTPTLLGWCERYCRDPAPVKS